MSKNEISFQVDVSDLFTKYGVDPHHKHLGEQKTTQILKSAIGGYFAKEVTANQLESLATQLYYELNNTTEINTQWKSSLSRILQRLTDFGYNSENLAGDLVKEIEEELIQFTSYNQ